MRLWTIFKIICAVIVIAVVVLSVFFTMHVMGKETPDPVARIFGRWMPEPGQLISKTPSHEDKVLEVGEMIDIEPGDKAFQKAAEMLATGKITEAREKLLFLINYYPSSNAAHRRS